MLYTGWMLYLFAAAWQDFKTKQIDRWIFAAGALLALFLQLQYADMGKELILGIVAASIPGWALLLVCRLSKGAVGEGDGWFFAVSGLFLNWREILFILSAGLVCCGIGSLIITASSFVHRRPVRGRTLAFLPFLVPAGIWLAILRWKSIKGI